MKLASVSKSPVFGDVGDEKRGAAKPPISLRVELASLNGPSTGPEPWNRTRFMNTAVGDHFQASFGPKRTPVLEIGAELSVIRE